LYRLHRPQSSSASRLAADAATTPAAWRYSLISAAPHSAAIYDLFAMSLCFKIFP
jgi:hypothetical protein